MAQKIGRNAPCPCGSGLKFKNCCASRSPVRTTPEEYNQLLKDPRFASIISAASDHSGRRGVTPIPSLIHENRRVRIVGNRVYFRQPKETFHEFLIYLLQSTLGKEWHDKQRRLPFEERHQLFKWFRALTLFSKSLIENPQFREGEHYGDRPTGDVQAVTSLAYDLFHLLHGSQLSDQLMNRLKDKAGFQGARYEIAVAAILSRAGYTPKFLQEKSKKHPDIDAHDQTSGLVIAIEAKSRHRPGALSFPGETDLDKALREDVENLINEALEQNPGDRPFRYLWI